MNKQTIINWLLGSLFLVSSSSWAVVFEITPQGVRPDGIAPGETLFAYYTVRNNTNFPRDGNLVHLPQHNVGRISSDALNSCGTDTFNLAPFGTPGDSCTLEMEITGPVVHTSNPADQIIVCFSNGLDCASTTESNSLNVPAKTSQMAYMADYSNNFLRACHVQPNGIFDGCSTLTDAYVNQPLDIIVNHHVTPPVAYIANQSSIAVCQLDENGNFMLGQCSSFQDPQLSLSTSLRLSPDGQRLYVTNSFVGPVGIIFCPVETDGRLTEPCQSTLPSFASPESISVAGEFAYITNRDVQNNITICQLETPDAFGKCSTFSDATFSGPTDMIVNEQVNPPVAYVANRNTNTLSVCNVDIAAGALSHCTAFSDTNLNDLSFTGLQLSPDGKWLYATQYNYNQVIACQVNVNGELSTCIIATTDVRGPNGRIGFATVNNAPYAYIASYNSAGISYCPLQSDGRFGTCTSVADVFSNPLAVAINELPSTNQQYLYIPQANFDSSSVVICKIDSNTGAISACQESTGDNTFQFTINVTNLFVNHGNAYIPNDASTNISFCAVNASDGTFNSCSMSNVSDAPGGRVLFATFNNQPYAYFANRDDGVGITRCNVDSAGTFNHCKTYPANFAGQNLQGLDINAAGDYLYAPAYNGTNKVFICPLDGNGDLASTCSSSTAALNLSLDLSNLFTANNNNMKFLPQVSTLRCDSAITSCDAALSNPSVSVWMERF